MKNLFSTAYARGNSMDYYNAKGVVVLVVVVNQLKPARDIGFKAVVVLL